MMPCSWPTFWAPLTVSYEPRHEKTVFSSPEPLGSQGELIVYPCSGVRPSVCPSTISNIFSSETAWPIKAKFYMEPPWEAGTKVYINGPGHMTKMAAMPIYSTIPIERAGRGPQNSSAL